MSDLVKRLRALADDCRRARQTSFAEGPDYEVTEEALREAADALEKLQANREPWRTKNEDELKLFVQVRDERDALKVKLDISYSEQAKQLARIVGLKARMKKLEAALSDLAAGAVTESDRRIALAALEEKPC